MFDKLNEEIENIRNAPYRPLPKEMTSIDTMHEHLRETATKAYKDGIEEIPPHWTIATKNGQVLDIITPFVGEDSKQTVATVMRGLMGSIDAIRYGFMSESWMVSVKDKSQIDGRPPSERDDRIEVLVVVCSDGEQSKMRAYELIRDWDSGSVTELKLLESMSSDEEGSRVEGRFANLLE